VSDYQFFLLAAAITALVAAGIDLRTGHIPNRLTLGALAVAPIAHGAATALRTHSASAAAVSLGASLLGATLCALLPLMMYRSLGLGGGDVKLFAAIGALTNAGVGLRAETYALRRSAESPQVRSEQMTPIPFGPAILAGTVFAAVMCWRAR
jgi:prepilin peptidase CpaA